MIRREPPDDDEWWDVFTVPVEALLDPHDAMKRDGVWRRIDDVRTVGGYL